jgi:hypothetical protein
MSSWQFPNPTPLRLHLLRSPAPLSPASSPTECNRMQRRGGWGAACGREGRKWKVDSRATIRRPFRVIHCQLSIIHCPLHVPQCPIPRVGGACVNLSFSRPKSAFPAPERHFSPCPSRVPFQGYGTSPDVHVNPSSLSIVRYSHPYVIRTKDGLQEKNLHVRPCLGRRRREPDAPSLVPSSAMRGSPDLSCTIRPAA